MTKQAIGLFLLSALAAAGGCNVCRAIVCDPFGTNTFYDGRRCGLRQGCATCGDVCDGPCGPGPVCAGPVCGRCGPRCGVAGPCGPCDDGCCGECGEPGCGWRWRRGIIRGPLSFIFRLFTGNSYRPCGGPCSGCGERYWGDWYGDPPEWHDPCDRYGNFIGGGPGVAPGVPGPYVEGPVPRAGGCRSCGQGGVSQSYGVPQRYPAQYAGRMPRYGSGQPAEVQGYAPQGSYAGQRYPARTQYAWRPQRYAAQNAFPSTADNAGPYAPRLISTTDRVVKPATTDQGPRLAQPDRPDVRQE